MTQMTPLFAGVALSTLAASMAVAQTAPPPPPPSGSPPPSSSPSPPASSGSDAQAPKRSSNAGVGKAIVACVASGVISTIIEAHRKGDGSLDPRDLTGREAALAMGRGCPPLFLLVLLYPPDNAGTYEVARWAHRWRKTPQGRMTQEICLRGAADGCSDNGMSRFAEEMGYAYRHGHVRAQFLRQMKAEVQIHFAKAKRKKAKKFARR